MTSSVPDQLPTPNPSPGAAIVIASAPNLRDLGGWATARGGHLRYGQVYRSTELSRLHNADLAAFEALNIRTVFDLRTMAEVQGQPDALPPGVRTVHLDVLADSSTLTLASLHAVLEDPPMVAELLGDGRVAEVMAGAYRDIIELPGARAAYQRLFSELADPDLGPALFHCTAGKDRTGWAAAALLTLLGVDSDTVMHEYLLTNEELLPALKPLLDEFAERGGDPNLLVPLLGVQPTYLQTALDQIGAEFGSIEAYFTDGLGLEPTTLDALRAKLVE